MASNKEVLRLVASAVVETVKECGQAPESMIHFALEQSMGLDYHQCQQIINALVGAGILNRESNLLTMAVAT